jgi:hypothetical protein
MLFVKMGTAAAGAFLDEYFKSILELITEEKNYLFYPNGPKLSKVPLPPIQKKT